MTAAFVPDGEVLEIAEIAVREGAAAEFERALSQALALLRAAPGCRGAQVFRVHEDDRSYRLLVRWDSVDSHCEGFQKSPAFVQWRAWIGPFFSGMPRVVHGLPLAFDTGAST